MNQFKKIGVVGAGTMGSAIAQKFAQQQFEVILVDNSSAQLRKGVDQIESMLTEGVEKELLDKESVKHILDRIKYVDNLSALTHCDIVVEAIYENFDSKAKLLEELSKILSKNAIIATNTSSFSVTELSKYVQFPDRFVGLHFFYHAAKNRLVEVIPGENTSPKTLQEIKNFCFLAGKDQISCVDAYGFVVNRYFVPWLNEAVRLHEEGISINSIDQVCMDIFGIGMGPFALMNATGISVAYHSQKTLEIFGTFYQVSRKLKDQSESGELWDLDNTGKPEVEINLKNRIADRMLGSVFLTCSHLLEEKVCSSNEINRGGRIGLRWKKGPIDLMNLYGEQKVDELIKDMTTKYQLKMPNEVSVKIRELENMKVDRFSTTAVITLNRPEDLNALNVGTIQELCSKFYVLNNDFDTKTIIITGAGKAFVAGADIKFFVDNIKARKVDNIVAFTTMTQNLFEQIDCSGKKIVAVLNGLSLGGGLELALCADVVLALPDVKMGFPETGLGIYPGLGGTRRAPQKVGRGIAKYLIYSCQILNTREAHILGLVDRVITPNEMFDILSGGIIPPIDNARKSVPETWKAIDNFFENHSVNELLVTNDEVNGTISNETSVLIKKIRTKAPIALKISEELISSGKRSTSDEIDRIFSTKDAWQGLTSIGKRVRFQGS